MLDDIGRAERRVRLESYIVTSDAVGRVFMEALSRCAARGMNVRLRADHAGSWRELKRADIERLRTAGVRFEWSRAWSLLRPFTLNRRNHRKLLVVDDAAAFVGGFNIHAPSSERAVGRLRWRDTHVRFIGETAAAAAVVFDRYHDVQPDWLPPKHFYVRCRTDPIDKPAQPDYRWTGFQCIVRKLPAIVAIERHGRAWHPWPELIASKEYEPVCTRRERRCRVGHRCRFGAERLHDE